MQNIGEFLKKYGADEHQHRLYMLGDAETSDLVGKTILEIYQDNDYLAFATIDKIYIYHHDYNCCESVEIDDIVGNLNDLIGSPILLAEESTSESNPKDPEYDESFTWTFYKFATIKGYVDVKWYGTSNGYYSESVDLVCAEIRRDA